MINGNWWKLRRNGKTKLWKRQPERFRIPVKYGLKYCGYLTDVEMRQINQGIAKHLRVESV